MVNKNAEIRTRLTDKHAELSNRLKRIESDRKRDEQPLDPDFGEQAVQRENDEVLDRLQIATAADLAQVTHALSRFDAGTYGTCEICGVPIENERLRALPQATSCGNCASSQIKVT